MTDAYVCTHDLTGYIYTHFIRYIITNVDSNVNTVELRTTQRTYTVWLMYWISVKQKL